MNTIGSYVFIDTSVFQEEGFFKPSGKVSKLFNLAENGKLNILMPAITRQEWLKHYKQNAKLPCKEFKRKAELLGDTSKIRDAINIIDSIDSEALIEESLSEHIKKSRVNVIGYDYCRDVESVFEKYFKQEKPFGAKGKDKEFPDAFVLTSLEAFAKDKHIRHIIILSKDADMIEYESKVFTPYNAADFLDKINIEIAETSEKEKRDVEILNQYIKVAVENYSKAIRERIVEFLSDSNLYDHYVPWQEIEDVCVNENIDLYYDDLNVRLTEVNEEFIEATCQIGIATSVDVEYMDESNSYWDSEEKEYLFKNYETAEVEISSNIEVTLRMDRTELDMRQNPMFELVEIECTPIESYIDEEY